MRRFAAALVVISASAVAHAGADGPATSDPPPFAYSWFVRALVGAGGVPNVQAPFGVTTVELGRHPFGGALSSALTGSVMGDPFWEHWYGLAGGVQLKLDLTYVFLTGLWAVPIESYDWFPVHVQLGSRVTVTYTHASALDPAYQLVRPELQTFIDVEIPLGRRHVTSFVVRGAVDTPVSLDNVFRWSFLCGFGFGWGDTRKQ